MALGVSQPHHLLPKLHRWCGLLTAAFILFYRLKGLALCLAGGVFA